MTEIPEQQADLQDLREAVRKAVQAGGNLQVRIRGIMLSAFSEGHLDQARIRGVTRSVLEGVAAAAESGGGQAAGIVQQAVAGVEDALLKVAEASRLAIQEASGRAAEFSRQDLGNAVDELASLEQLFLEIMGDIARHGTQTAASIFGDLLGHFRNSGTAFGSQVEEIAGELGRLLPQEGRNGMQAGMHMMQGAAERLAQIASGILAEVGSGLQSGQGSGGKGKPDKPEAG
jgi:hypothetical protein